MSYFYEIYKLKVKSELELDELISSEKYDKYDVIIKRGKVYGDDLKKPIWLHIEDQDMRLINSNAGKFRVLNGNEIIVEEFENSIYRYVKAIILGTCFGVLLKQRGNIVIHGGGINLDGKGVIISGECGAGKSTLLNGFREMGYKFLSDDVCSIKNGFINPSFPQQKLCKDAMEKFSYDITEFKKIDKEKDKYALQFNKDFNYSLVRFDVLIELEISDKEEVVINEIKGLEKLHVLIRNIYRVRLFADEMFNNNYFKECLKIAEKIKVYKVKRPKGIFSIYNQIELIKNELG